MTTFAELSPAGRSELWAILALRHAQGIGPSRARRLLEFYGAALSAAEACLDTPAAWAESGIVPLPVARKFAAGNWRDKAKLEWAAIQASGVHFLFPGNEQYPYLLRQINDPPLLLYYKGACSLLSGPAVGIVGARNCTREGIAVAAFFARDLSVAGVTVVSGMAKGIDRAAQLAGMEGPGRSIGVLGTGVDVVYPACNADLYALLSQDGLLISEYPPGTAAVSSHFPVRNRLISGLTQGILVVEAAGRSGSLITARLALEQNRDVFAVPGHTMAAVSAGCRDLIRRGAKAVFTADDILLELAPLLALEARNALEKRRAAAKSPDVPARNRKDERYEEALSTAQAVLPEGPLPWAAPPVRSKRSGRTPGKAAADKAPFGQSGGASGLPSSFETALISVTRPDDLTEEEHRLLDALGPAIRHIDDISRCLDMDVAKLSSLLTVLEVRGLVRRAPGMLYSVLCGPRESAPFPLDG